MNNPHEDPAYANAINELKAVLIESSDATSTWRTVGVSENILEASWQALVDSIEYKLLRDRQSR